MRSRGGVIWITGLPASGKSTLGRAIARALGREGVPTAVLDSDEVRSQVFPTLGHDPRSRARFYRALAQLAALLAREGLSVIVAATAHRRAFRDFARAQAPRFLEVFVATPVERCLTRDPKGLYARARRMRGTTLPGVGVRYQAPAAPEVTARDGRDRAAVKAVVARWVPPRSR